MLRRHRHLRRQVLRLIQSQTRILIHPRHHHPRRRLLLHHLRRRHLHPRQVVRRPREVWSHGSVIDITRAGQSRVSTHSWPGYKPR